MTLDVADAVRLADDAVGIDQVRAALGPLRHRLFRRPLRLVQEPHRVVGVGEQPEREAIFLGEPAVVLDRVEGGPEDLDAELLELRGSITEPRSLPRSPVGEGLGEPPERDPPPAQIGERDGLPFLIGERELGGFRAFRKHPEILSGDLTCPGRVAGQEAAPPPDGQKGHPDPEREGFDGYRDPRSGARDPPDAEVRGKEEL